MPQQQVAAARRVANSETLDRRFVQAAVLEVRARELSLRRSLQLLYEQRLRFPVHLHQRCPHAALRAFRGRTGLRFGNRYAALFRDQTQCVRKFAALHFHHEIENVSALAAAETVENMLDRGNRERRRLFLMERAKPAEILSRFREAQVFAYNPNNVGLLLDPLRSGTSLRHWTLGSQFYNRDGFAAALFSLERLSRDERMSLEELTESFSQGSGAVAVNDADPGNVCKGRIVKKFIHALGCLFDRRTDQIDFLRWLACSSL